MKYFDFFANNSRHRLTKSTDGLLLHSDNFHAIRLLENSYKQSLRTIYIDPPYNSPSSLIPYKNSYKHSSWLTLINNRVGESLKLLDEKGSLVIAIDENEHIFMTAMLKEMLGSYDITTVAIEHNKKGIQGDHFSYTNEYAVFAIPPSKKTLNRKKRNEADWE